MIGGLPDICRLVPAVGAAGKTISGGQRKGLAFHVFDELLIAFEVRLAKIGERIKL